MKKYYYNIKHDIYVITLLPLIYKTIEESKAYIIKRFGSCTINNKDYTNIFWYFFISNIFTEYLIYAHKCKIFYIPGTQFNEIPFNQKLFAKHLKSLPITILIDHDNNIQKMIDDGNGELEEFLITYKCKPIKSNFKKIKKDLVEVGMKKMLAEIEKYKYVLYT